ncbi:hypothetical protein [uncultured Roseivirga sp.]|uniref:hypothetical protein n=1 Tax=uncultured Roseivirga sp. TaxID=543088 RepID=UPI0030DC6E7D|tara:strand:- start:134876 stop:135280 length:405 start_codon:yes stop_codon:yes gene_type:complete
MKKKYSMKVLIIVLITPIVLLGQYLNEVYLPNYTDEWLSPSMAESTSEFIKVIAVILLLQLFRKKPTIKSLKLDILLVGIFYSTLELISLFPTRWFGTFDIMDIVAYSLATGFMYLMVNLLFRNKSSSSEAVYP